ncbi:MAG TPA: hypothetical protein VMZ06_08880 [Candidatus Bathyarchaeia archaeon]|nr:hypothetical protein [Candidatus Bathyarchaeia archaeon]
MKRFVIKLGAFALVNAIIAGAVLARIDSGYAFEQFETDSVLLSMPHNEEVGVLVMGTSRARVLTRVRCNLECLERELGCKVFNIAVPFGGGIVPEKLYLGEFYGRGNRVRTILFFLDPFTMFSPQPNQDHRFVYYEPLRPSLLLAMARNEIPFRRILIYVQSKFTWRWISQTAGTVPCDFETVKGKPDPEKARMRVESLYFDGLNDGYFEHYAETLRDILEMAKQHGARVVVALPPTLLGPQPGADRLMRQLDEFKKSYELVFYDFTGVITDTALFSDYDHLNSPGVETFVKEHLKLVLN